ncbi:MAG: hypothetical protein ABIE94_01365 [archaeon]
MTYEEEFELEDEFELDIINGERTKKKKMDVLNKKIVSKQELDELFAPVD